MSVDADYIRHVQKNGTGAGLEGMELTGTACRLHHFIMLAKMFIMYYITLYFAVESCYSYISTRLCLPLEVPYMQPAPSLVLLYYCAPYFMLRSR